MPSLTGCLSNQRVTRRRRGGVSKPLYRERRFQVRAPSSSRNGFAEPLSYHASIRHPEIEIGGGRSGVPDAISARENHRASSSSSSLVLMSIVRACAIKPSINDCGNGHGCEE